jgi:predicted transcriptional regulator
MTMLHLTQETVRPPVSLAGILPSSRKNRDCLEIIAFMLESTGRESKKTHIMYKANLSYTLLKKYLDMVVGSGLILYDSSSRTYRISQKGLTYLKEFDEIKKSMQIFREKKRVLESLLK